MSDDKIHLDVSEKKAAEKKAAEKKALQTAYRKELENRRRIIFERKKRYGMRF